MRREQRQTSIPGTTGDVVGVYPSTHTLVHRKRRVNGAKAVHEKSINSYGAIFTRICGEFDAGSQTDL